MHCIWELGVKARELEARWPRITLGRRLWQQRCYNDARSSEVERIAQMVAELATNEHLLLKHKLGKASSAHLTLPNDEYLSSETGREHERSRLPIVLQLSCLHPLLHGIMGSLVVAGR